MRRLQLILLFVGIVLFVIVVRRVGVDAIVSGLATMGWTFAAIFAIEILIDLLHSEAWRWCLPEPRQRISRLHLVAARTAGFSVNLLTATVGGEVVKGMLIRRWVPLVDGFASILVDKLTFAVGQAVFLIAGLFTVLQAVPLGAQERTVAIVVVVLWLSAVIAFFLLQRAGMFRLGLGVVRAIFGASALLERLPGHAATFDAKVTALLTSHRRDVMLSIGIHVLGQLARVPQFYLALSALGLSSDLVTCFTAAGGLVFIEATLFLIPAKLGVLEGGQVIIFSALGLGAAAGLTVSFAMRLSELASGLLGLAALGYFHFRYPTTKGPPDEIPAAPSPTTEAANERGAAQRTA